MMRTSPEIKLRGCVKNCGIVFLVSPSRIVYDPAVYCSDKCYRSSSEFREATIKGNLKQQNSKEPTELEKAGNEILLDVGVLFATQVLVANKFVVDAIIPSHSLVIQWDGDYWHGYTHHRVGKPLDERQRKRTELDRSQDAYLRKVGYTVIRFWEHEVKQSRELVKSKIETIVNGRKRRK